MLESPANDIISIVWMKATMNFDSINNFLKFI